MSNQKKNDEKEGNEDFLKDLEKKLKDKNQKQPDKQTPKPTKGINKSSLIFILLLIGGTLFLLYRENDKSAEAEKRTYTDFINGIKNETIKECTIIRNTETIEYSINDHNYETKIPYKDENLLPLLEKHNVIIHSEDREMSLFWRMMTSFLPWILIMVIFWVIITRQLRGRAGSGMSFGKSRAKLVNQEQIKETFNDVQGCDEAKEDMKDIISFLKDPKKFTDIGAKIPKGVLLMGPPGTGKTMLAKAVAGEAKVPFFSMSGSDFVEMFVGVGASRVRDLFETGKKHSPCILFIDELDAVGRTRGAGYGGGHDEREQTLNQMLVEMDGFDTHEALILMAATNRPDVLDKALLRPGRFDRQIVVDYPDVKGRKGILEIHAKKIKLKKNLSLDAIARGTPGFTGADLANLVNEAALIAAKKGILVVTLKELEAAKDKVIMGTERKSMLVNKEEKNNTAYHEAGHALVGLMLDNANLLHKVSIIPRGRSLGLTSFLPEDGKHTYSLSKIMTEIMILFGGRIAEDVIFNDFTNGAANDIERATKLAKSMVCEWGMSRMGPIAWGDKDEPVFIGREIVRHEDYSEETAKKIDSEMQRILNSCYDAAKKIIKTNLSKLKLLAKTLLEKETMDVDEIRILLKIKKAQNAPVDMII